MGCKSGKERITSSKNWVRIIRLRGPEAQRDRSVRQAIPVKAFITPTSNERSNKI